MYLAPEQVRTCRNCGNLIYEDEIDCEGFGTATRWFHIRLTGSRMSPLLSPRKCPDPIQPDHKDAEPEENDD